MSTPTKRLTSKSVIRPSFKPNHNTIGIRSGKQMTKAEMYEMLRKAVENTSSPRRNRAGDMK